MTDSITTHQAADDARNEDIHIYVNGEIVPRHEAKVSVYDSGFMLGDGIWEGLRLYNGKWAFLNEHMDRLFEAALALDLDIGMDRASVIKALEPPATPMVWKTTPTPALWSPAAPKPARSSIQHFHNPAPLW